MIRQFYLTNSNGEMLDLNKVEHFLLNPKGLGMERKFTYEQAGNYFIELTKNITQKRPEGSVFFPTYDEYRQFARFCEHEPLILTYSTDETYNIEVKVQTLEKSEKQTGGLFCKIRWISNGMWYKIIENQNSGSEEGKKYDYVYDYTYTDSAASEIDAEVNSLLPTPTKLTIIGPANNPQWEHRVNGQIVTTGKVNITVPAGKRLVIDTTEIPYTMIMSDNNGDNKENVYQNSDFTTIRFILMQYGRNVVRITHEGTGEIRLSLERREQYETV